MKKLSLLAISLFLSLNSLAGTCERNWDSAQAAHDHVKSLSFDLDDKIDAVQFARVRNEKALRIEFTEYIEASDFKDEVLRAANRAVNKWSDQMDYCSGDNYFAAKQNHENAKKLLNFIKSDEKKLKAKIEHAGINLAHIGNVTLAKEMSHLGFSLLSDEGESASAIAVAASKNYKEYVRYLLELGANAEVDIRGQYSNPLVSSVIHNNYNLFLTLLKHAKRIDHTITDGEGNHYNALDITLNHIYESESRVSNENYENQSQRMMIVIRLLDLGLRPLTKKIQAFMPVYIARYRFDSLGNDSIETATNVGRNLSGFNAIEKVGDIDFYKLEIPQELSLKFMLLRTNDIKKSIKFEVLDSAGNVISTMQDEVGTEDLVVEFSKGTYYIKVSGTGSEITNYHLDIDLANY